MLNHMLHIIGGMKDPTKLGAILGAVVDRIHELGGPVPSRILAELSDVQKERGR